MNAPGRLVLGALPDPVQKTVADFEEAFGIGLRISIEAPDEESSGAAYRSGGEPGSGIQVIYSSNGTPDSEEGLARFEITAREGPPLFLEILASPLAPAEAVGAALARSLERAFESAREVRYFTAELSERYEEIHLLYSISETLGTILHIDDAARVILREVCDVMGAKRGSLWLYLKSDESLHLMAAVGGEGLEGPIRTDDPDTVTSAVFREQRPIIASRARTQEQREQGVHGDSFLSVPIRYTPPSGESRTLGVMNVIGRRGDERYSVADQRLLAAIASQVGSALENKRLHQESVSRERMGREMELAHDLQQKLLPAAERFDGAEAAGRVSPAEQVGGDFYQLFKLSGGRVGIMLGDVSLHGFPSALIMTLTLSAAGIYAREHDSPATVLRDLDDALSEELETTEMFLTVFYGVIDPAKGRLVYSNAGHPHAFVVHGNGGLDRLTATDPPVGFAGEDAYGEVEVPWERGGDLLLLFTDGLSDVLASATRGDGEERVLDTVVGHRAESMACIVDALFALTADANPPVQGDDRTALVVRTP
ncbi:MAG: SpoIIE family protein phosphatase [Gemmatimonadetes bacterium]|nr:SpoIIE family protein phosphatase [Gemmatimonadota bacterium]